MFIGIILVLTDTNAVLIQYNRLLLISIYANRTAWINLYNGSLSPH